MQHVLLTRVVWAKIDLCNSNFNYDWLQASTKWVCCAVIVLCAFAAHFYKVGMFCTLHIVLTLQGIYHSNKLSSIFLSLPEKNYLHIFYLQDFKKKFTLLYLYWNPTLWCHEFAPNGGLSASILLPLSLGYLFYKLCFFVVECCFGWKLLNYVLGSSTPMEKYNENQKTSLILEPEPEKCFLIRKLQYHHFVLDLSGCSLCCW